MIKILYLHVGAEMYGADKVMFDLIRNLDKTKYEPYVILPEDGVLVSALKEENIRVDVIPYPILRSQNFHLKGIVSYCIDYIKYSRKIKQIAIEEQIDLIHNNTSAVLEGCYVSKCLKIPQIWVIHEIIMNHKIVFRFVSKIISKFSTATIVVSKAVKNHLESTGYFENKSIQVIYNGVDTHRFNKNNHCDYLYKEWNIAKKAKVIGMLGRVNSWKGQQNLLKAANIVMQKNEDLYTVFVGSAFRGKEWLEQQLREEIQKSPFKDRIIFENYRTDSECIHKLFDIFILPSTNPDPLPTVVLEAMASGKPVIGYRHGGICEMVKDGYNGYLVDTCNYEALASKIDFLLNNKALRNTMGKNSEKRLLEHFSMETYVKNFSREYDRLFQKKRNFDE